jgi:hypothetical protein
LQEKLSNEVVKHVTLGIKATKCLVISAHWDGMDSRFSVRKVMENRRFSSSMADVPENGVLETSLNMNPEPAPQLGPRRSLVHMTREALPRMANYRNMMSVQAQQRPTLGELHEGVKDAKVRTKDYI